MPSMVEADESNDSATLSPVDAVIEFMKGPEVQGLTSLGVPEPEPEAEAGPDLADDPPAEGGVNAPIPTRGPEARPVASDKAVDFMEVQANRMEIFVPADAHLQDPHDYLGEQDPLYDDRESRGYHPVRTPPPLSSSWSSRLPDVPTHSMTTPIAIPFREEKADINMPGGLETMMNDLSQLIDVLPVENAADESLPGLLQMLHRPHQHLQPQQQQSRGVEPQVVTYSAAERPTSRWRCKWRQLSPLEPQGSDMVGVDAFGNRVDFRNPYIKALKTTREELQKSWDLTAAASSASRLATERSDALASMQVFEVDEHPEPQYQGLSRLGMCMPEQTCREHCREHRHMLSGQKQDMCEVKIHHVHDDRRPPSSRHGHVEYRAPLRFDRTEPGTARSEDFREDFMPESARRGKYVVDQDMTLQPGSMFSREARYDRDPF